MPDEERTMNMNTENEKEFKPSLSPQPRRPGRPPKAVQEAKAPVMAEEQEEIDEFEPSQGYNKHIEPEVEEEYTPPARVMPPKPAQQAVAKKAETQSLSTAQSFGQTAGIKGDLLIPRVLLMQSLSQLVKDRKAYPGQIVRSSNGERLGGILNPGEPGQSIDVIPLSMMATWTVQLATGNKWLRSEPRTPENDSLPWEFVDEETGEECKRLKTIELIGLLSSDVAKNTGGVVTDDEDVPESLDDAVLLPIALSFRSSSYTAGKGVSTFFAKVDAARKQHPNTRPYHFTLPIGCVEEANDNGEFFVFEVGGAKKTPKELAAAAAGWYDQLAKAHVRIESELEGEARASTKIDPRPTAKSKF